jgi:hypothetical protein
MKNIKIYDAPKYSMYEYEKIKPHIYKKNDIFVTSISFEQEPDYDEGENATQISQYPLEDILDKFNVYVSDFYKDINVASSKTCYLELAGTNIDRLEEAITIVGKHIYNMIVTKDGNEYVSLIVE